MELCSYKQLIVWQRALELVLSCYKLTSYFPKEEHYGLVSQIRRSAVSIPSNIAEGRFRSTRNEYLYFLRIAYGSGAELETQIEIAKQLGFVRHQDHEEVARLLLEVMKMLNVMIRKLQNPNKLKKLTSSGATSTCSQYH